MKDIAQRVIDIAHNYVDEKWAWGETKVAIKIEVDNEIAARVKEELERRASLESAQPKA